MKIKKYISNGRSFSLILIFIFSCILTAKSEDIFDSKGKEHWLTFIPNYHNNINSSIPEFQFGDSLYIFITCDVPTKGKIDYKDVDGNSYTHEFEIFNPDEIYTFRISWFKFELQGYNRSSMVWSRFQSEQIAPQSFRVTSEDEVMVYAHSQSVMTSDAFLVLPKDVLGKGYYVMAYKSDISYGGTSNTPSQFAIVATEDETNVNIMPTTSTYIFGTIYQDIMLDRGDVYLVQADASGSFGYADLTGTRITSDKPVAVFGGQQRASVPAGEYNSTPSRDVLIEQMPPVKNWGKNAFIVPFRQESNQIDQGSDIYRVLAAYNDTEVTINENEEIIIDEFEFIERPIFGPQKIKANKPILVAQYKQTAGVGGSVGRGTGDPMMMLIPPKEQFMNNYRIINTQANEAAMDNFGNIYHREVYDKQYINIVCPTDFINTVEIDNNMVNPSVFQEIPDSDYSYGVFQVTDGVHAVNADAPFGIYIYGYGPANSYGYIGGMSFRPYDFLPPEINYVQDCFVVDGIFSDSTMNDTGIIEAYAEENSLVNVIINIEPFNIYDKIIPFRAELINNKLDGKFSLVARDSMEFATSMEMSIPGFTVAPVGIQETDQVLSRTDELRESQQKCFDLVLENYGNFEQKILDIRHTLPEISDDFSGPVFIQPGTELTVNICFSSDVRGEFIDSLIIVGECMERKAMDLKFMVKKDDIDPKLHRKKDPCNTTIDLIITDSTSFDYGLESITFPEIYNCEITNLEQNNNLYRYEIKVLDVFQDAYYTVIAKDLAGNEIAFYDTIPGFTLTISNPNIDTNIVDYGENIIGSLICKTIEVNNYGDFPLTIENLYLSFKTDYSVPESQLPAIIKPGETVEFEICFHPTEVMENAITDTVKILMNCAERKIPLLGNAEPKINTGTSKCDVPLKLLTNKVPKSFFLEVYPNPMTEKGIIRASIPAEGDYELYLSNIFGDVSQKIANVSIANGGIYEFEIETGDIPAGTYICTLESSANRVSKIFLLVK